MNIIYQKDCVIGVKELISAGSCSLVIADPPYNLGFAGTKHTKTKQTRFKTLVNDTLSPQEYRRFTFSWLKEAYRILKPGCPIYIFIDWRMYPYLYLWVQKVGFIIKNCVVWDKERMGMGYHYRYSHEFIIYGVKPSAKPARRPISRSIPDIWKIRKVAPNKTVHPTEKPVELYDRILTESSNPGERVVDFFVGSGPLFLSEYATERDIFGFEIDSIHIKTLQDRFADHSHIEIKSAARSTEDHGGNNL
ncbi:DNA-methyltransferase [Brevibacillus sp. SYSU BS000544]|uniref:DNA-methyltransferase n=1 Tax=Brevibacillus sp. SYSU BS000544 TaxID=3416443 RepID=UPI003CE5929D